MKENDYIIKGVKNKIRSEQIKNIRKYYKICFNIQNIVRNIVIDINNITYDEAILIDMDDNYLNEKFNTSDIITIFRYNSYFINMLSSNLVNEKVIIDFISSQYFAMNWFFIPIIFSKSLLKKISLNLLY